MRLLSKKLIVPVAALVLTLSAAGAAWAATGDSSTDTTGTTVAATATTAATAATAGASAAKNDSARPSNGEVALTGDTLTQATTAAVAAGGTGATVERASTETDNSNTAVKYEVMVKKSDGTFLMVYLDASFQVVSTETAQTAKCGHMGGKGSSTETPLTGDALTQATSAAVAAGGTGSTVERASTEDDNSNTAVKYEVMVKKSDGTSLMVFLDASFQVVSTEAAQAGHMGGGRGHGDLQGGTSGSTTSGSSTSSSATSGSTTSSSTL